MFKFLIYSTILIIVLSFVFDLLTRKFLNPYKLIMIFGRKGCGKSTTLCKLAQEYTKNGWNVFCTDKGIPNTIWFPAEWVGKYKISPRSLLLVEEVGTIWDNRQYKTFPTWVRDWFKYQRHEKVKVYLFSQSFDIDKKLRDLTDEMWLLENVMRVFSYGKRIAKKWVLTFSESDKPSALAENLQFASFFSPKSRSLIYIPKFAGLFDSFKPLELPAIPEVYPDGSFVELPDNLKTYYDELPKVA